ncbi:substrate-binding domain-containing protein [Marinobacterium rhizophilum]|uniref:substrate-binding domain-containing protein n=1 Tax=Marinobacterium rhizophilum TaxID=420402 RepID=UPI0021078CE9|nr:substrate-binding domain-containing protein [Marinobacterium rhizophilum]
MKNKTAERVLDAARLTGYPVSDVQPDTTSDTRPYRLGFLLQSVQQPFYRELHQVLEQALQTRADLQPRMLGRAQFAFIDDSGPRALARQIDQLAENCDALALVCYEHPTILGAIEAAEARGIPVVALLSPLGSNPMRPYMGLDNRKVGRSAGWAMAQLTRQAGKVGIFVGSHRFVGHELREMGFRSYCREQAPQIEVLEHLVSLDDADIAYRGTRTLIHQQPDLCGLYVASGGTEGVLRALREAQLERPLCVIIQELTPEARQALIDGVVTLVVSTPLRQLADDSISQLLAALQQRDNGSPAPAAPPVLPFILYTAENC